MSGDHCRAEGFARPCAAIPPAHVLDVLRDSEQSVDRCCRVYCRGRLSGEREVLGDELDPLTLGRSTLARWGDRRVIGGASPLEVETPGIACAEQPQRQVSRQSTLTMERRSPGRCRLERRRDRDCSCRARVVNAPGSPPAMDRRQRPDRRFRCSPPTAFRSRLCRP